VKFVRLRRTKIPCTPSYADCRPKTNVVTLFDMGHTLRGDCTLEGYRTGGKETKYLMCSLYRNECSLLQLAGATMGKGLGSSEEVWWRLTNLGGNIYLLGNITRNLPV
jgi:hypothetical protein